MAAPARTNQYFIPGDGISREVIQADICRYLGNDALVRPGQYQGRDGFYITAYRNLTSAMIADLKADSARWEAERREGEARGYPTAYRSSAVHQSRQYYGPSEGPQPPPGGTAGGPVFVTTAPGAAAYGSGYDQPQQYPSSTAGYQGSGSNYAYTAGGNFAPGSEPRSSYYTPTEGSNFDPSSAQRGDPYSNYSGAPVPGPGQPTPRGGQPSYQPRDPYGRGGYNYPPQ
ncbi:MAG: hypothetical protein M1813_001460 [Trichoglossum hirsutum]|nr:MAG: hypothetical protein M1813_001460 [Trichoglossum hirsutum]